MRSGRVQMARLYSARKAFGAAQALGAALDQSLDSQLEGEEAALFDAILLDVGWLEAAAASCSEARAARGGSSRRIVPGSSLELGPSVQGARSRTGVAPRRPTPPLSRRSLPARTPSPALSRSPGDASSLPDDARENTHREGPLGVARRFFGASTS